MVKERNIVVCIILSLLTCGLYGIYWFISLTNDTNKVANVSDTSGGLAFVFTLLTCGIYGWYWAYKLGQKLDIAASNNGRPVNNHSILFLILTALCLGIVVYCIAQSEINDYAKINTQNNFNGYQQ